MVKQVKHQLLVDIDNAILKSLEDREHRNYMGASGLGEPCDAALWFSYKYPTEILDPRIHRIFDLGNLLEVVMVQSLRKAGYKVHTHDDKGEQFGFVDGVIAGHIDGVIELADGPALIEFKSYKNSRFNTMVKDGVKISDPKYFTQVQVYMGEFELKKSIFMAYNKDTSELHIEQIEYDIFEHRTAMSRGHTIAIMDERPERKYDHVSSFKCKMCSYRTQCWKGEGNEE
jgi:hypothetical protein